MHSEAGGLVQHPSLIDDEDTGGLQQLLRSVQGVKREEGTREDHLGLMGDKDGGRLHQTLRSVGGEGGGGKAPGSDG